jgi:hypothetical protein
MSLTAVGLGIGDCLSRVLVDGRAKHDHGGILVGYVHRKLPTTNMK